MAYMGAVDYLSAGNAQLSKVRAKKLWVGWPFSFCRRHDNPAWLRGFFTYFVKFVYFVITVNADTRMSAVPNPRAGPSFLLYINYFFRFSRI